MPRIRYTSAVSAWPSSVFPLMLWLILMPNAGLSAITTSGRVAGSNKVSSRDKLQHELGAFSHFRMGGQSIIAGRHLQTQHGGDQTDLLQLFINNLLPSSKSTIHQPFAQKSSIFTEVPNCFESLSIFLYISPV